MIRRDIILELELKIDSPNAIAFANDSSSVAIGGQGIEIYDTATWSQRILPKSPLRSRKVFCICFSNDNERMAAGLWNGDVELWDPLTGRQLITLSGPNRVPKRFMFSSEKLRVLDNNGSVWSWNISPWKDQLPRK